MKKNKLYSLTLITGLCLSFIGCGKSNVPAITETAVIFMEAMEEADMDNITTLCTEAAFDSLKLKYLDSSYQVNDFFRGMGVDKELFSEEALEATQNYFDYYVDALIKNYTINSVTEKNTVGHVNVTVTTYDRQTLKNDINQHLTTEFESLIEQYTDEHIDELSAIYLENGEIAMTIKILDALMDEFMDILKNLIDTAETTDVTIVLTVEKIDNEWLVTNAEEIY